VPKEWLKIKDSAMTRKRWETPENGFHNLAKVRFEGLNPFARSNFLVIAKSKRPLLEGPLSNRFNAKA
jgi:hypothetical protein